MIHTRPAISTKISDHKGAIFGIQWHITHRLILLLAGADPSANETALAKNCVPFRPATNCPRYRLNRSAERLHGLVIWKSSLKCCCCCNNYDHYAWAQSTHTLPDTWSAGFGPDEVGLPMARSREPQPGQPGQSTVQTKAKVTSKRKVRVRQADRRRRSQRAIAMMYGEGLGIVLKLSNFQWNACPVWEREREGGEWDWETGWCGMDEIIIK